MKQIVFIMAQFRGKADAVSPGADSGVWTTFMSKEIDAPMLWWG